MSRTKLAVLGIIVIFVGLTTAQTLYTVRETEQAIVLQFGKPIRVVTEPGLAYKLPFIQNVVTYDDRILDLDPAEVQILLTDKKRINVDAYARYRIIDPLKFFQAARTEAVLRDRFGKIINSAIRQEIAKNSLGDLLSEKRLSIMQAIQSKVSSEAPTFGIEITDVRIGRTDLPPTPARPSITACARSANERLGSCVLRAPKKHRRSVPVPTASKLLFWQRRIARRIFCAARARGSVTSSSVRPLAGIRSFSISTSRWRNMRRIWWIRTRRWS